MTRKPLGERYLERAQGQVGTLQNILGYIESTLGPNGAMAGVGKRIGQQSTELAREFYDLGLIAEFNARVKDGVVEQRGAVPIYGPASIRSRPRHVPDALKSTDIKNNLDKP